MYALEVPVGEDEPGEATPVFIALDELPYGNFIEIEGATIGSIKAAAAALGLDWESRVEESYVALWTKLRQDLTLPFRDLTFSNLANLDVSPEHLGVVAAIKDDRAL